MPSGLRSITKHQHCDVVDALTLAAVLHAPTPSRSGSVLAQEGSAAQPLRPPTGSTAGGRRRKPPVRASKDPGGRVRHGPQGGLLPTAGRARGVDLGRKATTQLSRCSMGLSAQPYILDVGALHSVHLIQSTAWTAYCQGHLGVDSHHRSPVIASSQLIGCLLLP